MLRAGAAPFLLMSPAGALGHARAAGVTRAGRLPRPGAGNTDGMDNCPTCGKQLVRLEVTVGGEDLTMKNCSNCDRRQWERNGDGIDLAEVLDLTADLNRREKSRSELRRS